MATDAELISEQLQHTIDLLRSDISAIRAEQKHQVELVTNRLERLDDSAKDHEQRLRQVHDSATQFKLLASLATGGGLLSVISLLKALLGGP